MSIWLVELMKCSTITSFNKHFNFLSNIIHRLPLVPIFTALSVALYYLFSAAVFGVSWLWLVSYLWCNSIWFHSTQMCGNPLQLLYCLWYIHIERPMTSQHWLFIVALSLVAPEIGFSVQFEIAALYVLFESFLLSLFLVLWVCSDLTFSFWSCCTNFGHSQSHLLRIFCCLQL